METIPNTISASRVPAVLGLDKRCSPLTLFLRLSGKIQERDISDNEAVREGRYYERATAEIACAKYGMKIVDGFEQKTLHSGVLSGHPDFLAVDEHGKLAILEVKNPFWSYAGGENDDDWGEPGTDQAPKAYLLQAMVYNHLFREWVNGPERSKPRAVDIFDKDVADYSYVVARLRGGVERFKIPYDPQVIAAVEREVQMMLTRVEIGDPPDPRDEEDMRNRWMADPEKTAPCNREFIFVLDALRKVKEQIKHYTEQESALKTQILGLAQDCGVIEYVDHETGVRIPVVTAKPTRSFDAAKCMAEHRELLIENDYVTVDTARLRKEQKSLYETYMAKPDNVTEQKRQIRLKDKAIDQIMEASK